MRTMLLAITITAAFVSGCATNLDGVRRFAQDTDTLVAGVNTQFAYLPTSCQHRLELVELISDQKSEILQQTKITCEDLATSAKAAEGMTEGVSAYAKALGALAQDNLATYSSELDGLANSLKGLKQHDQTPAIPADKIDALSKVTNLVLEAATKGMRQRELKSMLAEHDSLAAILGQLASMLDSEYVVALKLEQGEYKGKTALLKRKYSKMEPLRTRELVHDYMAASQGIDAKIDAAKKSADALRALIAAHTALKKNADKLNTIDQLKEINDYRKSVVEVRDALANAF